ncbi:MAG: ABC transporter permease, partial [Leptolyngbya sp. SIO4C1]|nr:ABC transporter permease [Leptolyngbya sp. SIO4C1]
PLSGVLLLNVIYALVYTLLLLLIAVSIFARRQF